MKVFDKIILFNKRCVEQIISERKIVQKNNSPFLTTLVEAFQDRKKLYLIISYMPFGDLRKLLVKKTKVIEDEASIIQS